MRRLVLDGAVAQRHADQRQAAIERLQEREEEFRAGRAKAEQAYRDRVRDLEAKVAAAAAAAREGETARTLAALRTTVVRIDERTRRMEARSLAGIVGRAARAAARRLPQPAEQSLQRGRRVAQRAAAEPAPPRGPSQRTLRGRVQATKLPPPAQQALRRGGRPTAGRPPNPARRPSRSPGACPTPPSAPPAAPGWRARRSG